MEASVRNMREHYKNGVLAYSPATGEEYSADPRDYWNLGEDVVLMDANSEPMILVTRNVEFTELGEDNG